MDPVPIACASEFAGATMLFRYAGGLYVTVIVKRSFALVPGSAEASPLPPMPVVRAELGGGRHVVPDELAPCVPKAEVWAIGQVRARVPGAVLDVALRVRRGGVVLLEKRARIATDARAAGQLDAFGPISKRVAARSRRLGTTPAAALEGPFVDVPDAIDWTYFQATVPDQQIPSLDGGDDVALEILGVGELSMRLPKALPEAILRETSGTPRRIELSVDSVSFDVDRATAHVVYRGRESIVGDPRRANVDVRVAEPAASALAPSGGGVTAAISEADAELVALRAQFATPFRAPTAGASPAAVSSRAPLPARSGLTVAADDAEIAALRAEFMPFAVARAPTNSEAPVPLEATPQHAPEPAARIAEPLEPLRPIPAAPLPSTFEPLPGATVTAFADADEVAALRAQYATPFDKPSAKLARQRGAAPKTSKPEAPKDPLSARSGETVAADPEAVQALREQYAPFAKAAARSSTAAAAPSTSPANASAGANFLDAVGEGDPSDDPDG